MTTITEDPPVRRIETCIACEARQKDLTERYELIQKQSSLIEKQRLNIERQNKVIDKLLE